MFREEAGGQRTRFLRICDEHVLPDLSEGFHKHGGDVLRSQSFVIVVLVCSSTPVPDLPEWVLGHSCQSLSKLLFRTLWRVRAHDLPHLPVEVGKLNPNYQCSHPSLSKYLYNPGQEQLERCAGQRPRDVEDLL